jgi:hypothetical protein
LKRPHDHCTFGTISHTHSISIIIKRSIIIIPDSSSISGLFVFGLRLGLEVYPSKRFAAEIVDTLSFFSSTRLIRPRSDSGFLCYFLLMRYERREYVVRDMIQDTGAWAIGGSRAGHFHAILMYILAANFCRLLDVMKGSVLLVAHAYAYASCSCFIVPCLKQPHDDTEEDGRLHGQKCFAFYFLTVLDNLCFLVSNVHCTSRPMKAHTP